MNIVNGQQQKRNDGIAATMKRQPILFDMHGRHGGVATADGV